MSTSGFEHADARVVHQDVKVAERFEDIAIGPLDIRSVRDVGLNGERAKIARRLVEPALVAPGNGDTRPGVRQGLRNGEAYAARAACDQRACTFEIHIVLAAMIMPLLEDEPEVFSDPEAFSRTDP
jgi:hypothetical protein